MARIECYIEEYKTENGLGARLRDKKTGKKVIILAVADLNMHLKKFLGAAKTYKRLMPTVFNRDGHDIVAVRGIKRGENKKAIFIEISTRGGGYLFEDALGYNEVNPWDSDDWECFD